MQAPFSVSLDQTALIQNLLLNQKLTISATEAVSKFSAFACPRSLLPCTVYRNASTENSNSCSQLAAHVVSPAEPSSQPSYKNLVKTLGYLS